jgi:FtsZ-binding cell division protein ZapB
MKIDVSIGEVVDKITILQIKMEKITDSAKLVYIEGELRHLSELIEKENVNVPKDLVAQLKDVNLKLWEAEDIIREKEKTNTFDDEFIKCARLDAKLNDERFLVKNEINNVCDSYIKEQKSYYGLYTAD